MGCKNINNNVATTPQCGGNNFVTAYPMRGFILVASPPLFALPQAWPFAATGYGSSPSAPGMSCSDIYSTNPAARRSGQYFIAVASSTIPVYCDMLAASGGWTLVAMLASSITDTTWASGALGTTSTSTWILPDTINPTVTDINANVNMKNLAYSSLPFSTIRFVFGPPSLINTGFTVSAIGASTQALFTGGALASSIPRTDFITAVSSRFGGSAANTYAGSPNCNTVGISQVTPSSYCRFGIALNNEGDCLTCDAW
jgi:hypothetical protein